MSPGDLEKAAESLNRLATSSGPRRQCKINRIYDGIEAETRKSQASFQII